MSSVDRINGYNVTPLGGRRQEAGGKRTDAEPVSVTEYNITKCFGVGLECTKMTGIIINGNSTHDVNLVTEMETLNSTYCMSQGHSSCLTEPPFLT